MVFLSKHAYAIVLRETHWRALSSSKLLKVKYYVLFPIIYYLIRLRDIYPYNPESALIKL